MRAGHAVSKVGWINDWKRRHDAIVDPWAEAEFELLERPWRTRGLEADRDAIRAWVQACRDELARVLDQEASHHETER